LIYVLVLLFTSTAALTIAEVLKLKEENKKIKTEIEKLKEQIKP
jgi:cell division protein FtsB